MMPPLVCAGCGKRPGELDCYRLANASEEHEGGRLYPTEDDYVRAEEGTLNRLTGQFLCDDCYIAAGMPTAPGGWKVPS